MIEIDLDGRAVRVLPVVKGLSSEADRVEEAFLSSKPSMVMLPISEEQLAALGRPEEFLDYEPSAAELAYAHHLSHFGEVMLPPPCWLRALSLCEEHGLPVTAIDMGEESFSDLYLREVGALELFREARFAKKSLRRRFDLSSPEAFALDWDSRLSSSRGFRAVERERERHMAAAMGRLATDGALALLERERSDGVLRALRTRLPSEP